ncbi:hypothetical protein BWQ96_10581 [Gracilariopsis chorda]|uniref:Uncharacterized protein n=1 Tax=Gracilariopsis chorda TaxID=448386 RepID=A0A2V3IC86_9FLOR|nr:hypothetical protein BWQ96_10581 [Gracilariopsis chorda]|eukprot:PXF39716.1 hypothetical protein BWQ96_10581 [Gracilariopsis chorda]
MDRQTIIEPIHSTEGGVPTVSSFRDPATDADVVGKLVESPLLSASTTPLKRRRVSSTPLRSSQTGGVDGSLGLSLLDLSNLLGLSADEASLVIVPDEITQDKMKFIFNNLCQAMMDEKVMEMLAILKPELFDFLQSELL